MATSIVIVDDHVLIAKAITSIIEQFRNYEVLYESENGKELVEKFKLKKNIPDIVLLDISMPVMDGFETAIWLKQNHPEVKVMVLTMQGNDESLIGMIRLGLLDILIKMFTPPSWQVRLMQLLKKDFITPTGLPAVFYITWQTRLNQVMMLLK